MAERTILMEELDDLGIDVDDPKIIDGLLAFCDIYSLSEERISCLYLAFSSKNQSSTSEALKEFEKRIKSEVEKKASKRNILHENSALNRSLNTSERFGFEDEDEENQLASIYGAPVVSTPKRIKTKPISSQESSESKMVISCKYGSRTNARDVLIRYDSKSLSDSEWKRTKIEKDEAKLVKYRKPSEALMIPYRYMFERLRDKAGNLDEIICKIEHELMIKHDLEEGVDLSNVSSEIVTRFGRICCDSEGKLNSRSIVLQGSQDPSSGKALPMDSSKLTEYSFFPGQIVGVKGTNPNGNRVVASEVFIDASPLNKNTKGLTIPELSLVIASGPYTTSDNLAYEPYSDLLCYVKEYKPRILVLIGPFVDSKHPLLETSPDSFETIFAIKVMKPIVDLLSDESLDVVIVPSSTRDVHHHYIYPTPPFDSSVSGSSRLHMVSDPCILNIGGLVVGITSTDILFHLGKEEISFPPRNGDRMRRLAKHLLLQRSFYPLYPPSEDLNVDYEKLESHCSIEESPDLLILPSDFMHFFKDIDKKTLVVNPSRLSKGSGGGVFARILFKRGSTELLENTHAEIVRI